MKNINLLVLCSGVLVVSWLSGCATIVKSESQPVAFSSGPEGATVAINGMPRGITPTTIMVERKYGDQMVTMSLKGYRTEHFKLQKHVAGMTFGNIIFGGIIGVGVDIATGKATNYQESVRVMFEPDNDSAGRNASEGTAASQTRLANQRDGASREPSVQMLFKNGLGLVVKTQNDKILVIEVKPESAASNAKIQPDDEILKYNDVEVINGDRVVEGAINEPFQKNAKIVWRSENGPPKTATLDWSAKVDAAANAPIAVAKAPEAAATLKSNQSDAAEAFGGPLKASKGLGLRVDAQNGQIWVREVSPDSAAASANIQPDDEILGFNGQTPANQSRWLSASINQPTDRVATIVWRSKDGTQKTAKLEW